MATKNLGFNLINGSDVVDPGVLNQNFEKADALGVDYVVESGTSGSWWYRKWKSGRAECGVDDKNLGTLTCDQPWPTNAVEGGYLSNYVTFGSYPFAFASTPHAMISFNYNTGGGRRLSYIQTLSNNYSNTTTSPQFAMVYPVKATSTDCHFGIYVVGRWK